MIWCTPEVDCEVYERERGLYNLGEIGLDEINGAYLPTFSEAGCQHIYYHGKMQAEKFNTARWMFWDPEGKDRQRDHSFHTPNVLTMLDSCVILSPTTSAWYSVPSRSIR